MDFRLSMAKKSMLMKFYYQFHLIAISLKLTKTEKKQNSISSETTREHFQTERKHIVTKEWTMFLK